jgi:ubiquinone/menaquinone biosynthesis C-methylase UbiE
VYDGLNYLYPYRHLLSETQRRLKIAPGDSVLDLGCGTGNLTRLINQNHDVKVVAIDGSTSMLGTLKRKLRSQIKQGQVEVVHSEILEFLRRQPDKTFDRIAMVNVVYAVSDRMRLWEEVVRVLKPSGIAVATTSDRTGSWPIIKEHWRNDTKIKLFHPKLLMVSIIDAFISEFSKTSVFNFVPQEELFDEVKAAGGKPSNPGRTYGGDKEGVNIIFDVRRS